MNHCSSGSVSDCQCLNGQGKALSMAGIESHLLVGGALGNRKVLILKAFHIIVSTRRINNWGGGKWFRIISLDRFSYFKSMQIINRLNRNRLSICLSEQSFSLYQEKQFRNCNGNTSGTK